MKEIKIGSRTLGKGHPCFIIAEVSCNHLGQYEKAEELVRAAGEAGADAIKLQTYTADTMTIDCDNEYFRVNVDGNPDSWQGMTLYKLYEEAYTPWDWQPKLKALANEYGMELFSTAFDQTAVDFLEQELDPPCYKIASYELTDDTLLEAVAKTGRPIIISNGYATLEELEHAHEVLTSNGAKDVVVLYCVTEYADSPTSDNVNLSTMADIEKRFNVVAGFSDNNGGIDLPIMSVLAGGHAIEKHLIIDKNDPSHDQRFSIVPDELKEMIEEIRRIEGADESFKKDKLEKMDPEGGWLGEPTYGPTSALEKQNTRWRRSLFVVKDIKKGEKITEENIRSIRPEGGLAPKHYRQVLGNKAKTDVKRGTPLSWDLLE